MQKPARPHLLILITMLSLMASCTGMKTQGVGGNLRVRAAAPVLIAQTQTDLEDDGFGDFEDEFEPLPEKPVSDPLSGYNRAMTKFNDKFFDYVLSPVAKGYNVVVPEGGRIGIRRFFKNLFFPMRFLNNFLQLKYDRAAIETARFVVNSTVGLLGFFDPAKNWLRLEAYPEDFGQTLGFYGVGPGPHLVLPFLGPSNLRDTLGFVADTYSVPIAYIPEMDISGTSESDRIFIAAGVESYRQLNKASLSLEEYESLRRDALDLYTFLRDAYERNRAVQIKE
ncbi:MAG: VacJ family lipoprotein [Nitrospiria bacterium]